MSCSSWARADALLGIPLTIAADRDGSVVSYSAVALERRDGIPGSRARALTASALGEVFGANAVSCEQALVRVDLRAATPWLNEFVFDGSALSNRAGSISQGHPLVHAQGTTLAWSELVAVVGRDSALWAVLASASKSEPFVIGPSVSVLESRTDAHPLALVRRAHAALAVRLEQCGDQPLPRVLADRAIPEQGLEAGSLLSALALVERAAFDGVRTRRSRPVIQAVLNLADAGLRYLEVTPVTRTNLPLSEVARTVLADALDAARLAAPVPY